MKRLLVILLLLTAFVATPVQAQISKIAKKEAKALKRKGWVAHPAKPTIEEQLLNFYEMQYEYDEHGHPRYIYGIAQSTGLNYDSARWQAITLAKIDLSGNIQTEVIANINDKMVDQNEKEYTIKTITSKSEISIGTTKTIMEIYRKDSRGNLEVRIVLCCEGNEAKSAIIDANTEELKKYDSGLTEKVNKALGL